ncbi:hypothetical protein ID866_4834 [Astraeus odoratus]|nr:hypothetical protein ID866_4834 [Astraeus odoratus]
MISPQKQVSWSSARYPPERRQTRPKAIDFISEPESDGGSSSGDEEEEEEIVSDDDESDEMGDSGSSPAHSAYRGEEGGSSNPTSPEEEEEDDADADAPRVSQWVDDDETLDEGRAQENWPVFDSQGSDNDEEDVQVRSLKSDLSTLPLGVLRRAQRSLAQVQALSDSEVSDTGSEPSEDDETASHIPEDSGKTKEDPKKKGLPKRPHKHAPTEVSSKRPVSRRRVVVEDHTSRPRDPRFLHVSGKYEPEKFRQQYGFLSGVHTSELKTLRDDYKRARKLLANSPRDLRAMREEEVKRLELAMKRAESAVNRDTKEKVEADALRKVAQAEKEKRKQGKGAWFMKRSEKKDLLNKARYDALAASGGRQAVKKAIEKKQRKIGQKERKSRPFTRDTFSQDVGSNAPQGRKRSAGPADSMSRGTKRRKVAG